MIIFLRGDCKFSGQLFVNAYYKKNPFDILIKFFFSVLHALIIVPFLSIPPEAIILQIIFGVIALHSNLFDTA